MSAQPGIGVNRHALLLEMDTQLSMYTHTERPDNHGKAEHSNMEMYKFINDLSAVTTMTKKLCCLRCVADHSEEEQTAAPQHQTERHPPLVLVTLAKCTTTSTL